MTFPDIMMACGLALSGAAIVMAFLTFMWEEAPPFLLAWPRWFVLGEILVLGSML